MSLIEPIEFVRVERITHQYGSHVALKECSFTLSSGEVLGLAGENGAGKSTLAKILIGFLTPTSGEVRIGGVDPVRFRTTHGVGYLPEELAAYGNYTTRELFAIRQVAGAPMRVEEVVAILDLGHLMERPLHSLSKGQKRLAFTGYAALGASRLIVLDEPDSGLDPAALDRLQALVRACAGYGALVVVLSHQLHEMESFCDWLAIIRKGSIAGWYDRSAVAAIGARNLYRQQATS